MDDMIVSVFDFLDYRVFLKNEFQRLKKKDRKYSHRFFVQKLRVKSSGFITEVLGGKRNLSRKHILLLIKSLKLDNEDALYFEYLVHFNQARSIEEKDHWLIKMMGCKKVNTRILNHDVYEYFSKWYYTALRELIFYYHDPVKPGEIALMLDPPISRDEAQQALSLLERLSLVEKQTNGSYCQKETVLSTGSMLHSMEIANYQLQTIELAKKALNVVALSDRDITTLTMSISSDAYAQIINILKTSKKNIVKVVQNDTGEDRVYQMNIQFFPLTKLY